SHSTSTLPCNVSHSRRSVCASVCFFFFFYGYVDHRDLHSFPTRRSSDLVRRNSAPRNRCGLARAGASRSRSAAGGALRHDSRPGDRKSTRLNSSHLVISYAVFCLKKKKKT